MSGDKDNLGLPKLIMATSLIGLHIGHLRGIIMMAQKFYDRNIISEALSTLPSSLSEFRNELEELRPKLANLDIESIHLFFDKLNKDLDKFENSQDETIDSLEQALKSMEMEFKTLLEQTILFILYEETSKL
jgi:predicted nuclease with TOPRIM domain